jgi:hypothetical protein
VDSSGTSRNPTVLRSDTLVLDQADVSQNLGTSTKDGVVADCGALCALLVSAGQCHSVI